LQDEIDTQDPAELLSRLAEMHHDEEPEKPGEVSSLSD